MKLEEPDVDNTADADDQYAFWREHAVTRHALREVQRRRDFALRELLAVAKKSTDASVCKFAWIISTSEDLMVPMGGKTLGAMTWEK